VAAVEAAAATAERARAAAAERARADIAVAAAERLVQWEESAPRRARATAAESRLAAAQWAATQGASAGETGAGEAGAVAPREPAAVPEGTASAEFARDGDAPVPLRPETAACTVRPRGQRGPRRECESTIAHRHTRERSELNIRAPPLLA
jgi:hypothetical protein